MFKLPEKLNKKYKKFILSLFYIIISIIINFKSSPRLKEHLKFMLDKGSTYLIYNDNLIYHGCIPLDEDGQFKEVLTPKGKLKGKLLFDYIDMWNH